MWFFLSVLFYFISMVLFFYLIVDVVIIINMFYVGFVDLSLKRFWVISYDMFLEGWLIGKFIMVKNLV